MSANPAVGHAVADSPHVNSATNVRRGDTPAVWDAAGSPGGTGPWKGVDDESGPAGPDGNTSGSFEDGPGRWKQT
jgi:hypothetical protein